MEIFKEVSKLSSKYDEQVCEKKWESFSNYEKNVDNLLLLFSSLGICLNKQPLFFDTSMFHFENLNSFGNDDIARMFASKYSNYVKWDNKQFFVFKDKWYCDEHHIRLSDMIINDFKSLINEDVHILENKLRDGNNFGEINNRLEILNEIKDKIQSGYANKNFSHVFPVCLNEPDFSKCMNANPYLIGFDNGVFDLENRVFRPFCYDDIVSISVGYDYNPDDNEYREDVLSFLHQIFLDEDIFHYMQKYLSTFLVGKDEDELLMFWTGLGNKQTGANGKSTLCSLLNYTLGNYYTSGASTIITGKKEKSQCANPAMYEWKYKRCIPFQEIENDDETKINMSRLKECTGGDTITTRNLYKSNEQIKPSWKLVICANNIPSFSTTDGGTVRRVRNVPFESKFVDDVDDIKWKNLEHVFPIDKTLKSNLDKFAPSFMNLLIEWYYEIYKIEGIKDTTTPLKITVSNEKMINKQHNDFFDVIENNILPYIKFTDCDTDVIPLVHIKDYINRTLGYKFKREEIYDYFENKYIDFYRSRFQKNKSNTKECIIKHSLVLPNNNYF